MLLKGVPFPVLRGWQRPLPPPLPQTVLSSRTPAVETHSGPSQLAEAVSTAPCGMLEVNAQPPRLLLWRTNPNSSADTATSASQSAPQPSSEPESVVPKIGLPRLVAKA